MGCNIRQNVSGTADAVPPQLCIFLTANHLLIPIHGIIHKTLPRSLADYGRMPRERGENPITRQHVFVHKTRTLCQHPRTKPAKMFFSRCKKSARKTKKGGVQKVAKRPRRVGAHAPSGAADDSLRGRLSEKYLID